MVHIIYCRLYNARERLLIIFNEKPGGRSMTTPHGDI